jgi:hypothetical protein
VFENAECLTNSVAGDEEFGGQLVFSGQPVGIGTGMDLLAQHVGGPAGTVGPGSTGGYDCSHAVTLMQLRAAFRARDRDPTRSRGYCAG